MSDFVDIRGLQKAFRSGAGRLEVLRGLDLTVPRGRMLAVTGASGTGKSTFLHLLGGMERPDAGSIRVEGREIESLSAQELARYRNQSVGFVFQFHHLLREFTASENVMFPLLLRRVSFSRASREAIQRLSEVGLADRAQHKPGELSGGEQQRVAVARALIGRPSLILADEPTGDLDEATSESVFSLLRNLHRAHGLTSILVTHEMKFARRCDDMMTMAEGRLVKEAS